MIHDKNFGENFSLIQNQTKLYQTKCMNPHQIYS